MDDTLKPDPFRPARRAGLPFVPAALLLGLFALLAVWPPAIPGLPRAPRLVLLAALLAGTLAGLSKRGSRPAAPARRGSGRAASGRRPAIIAVPAEQMVASPAWLHVMSAPDAGRLTRGLLEAAAALIERGDRLLVVDGARRLRFHEAIRCEGGPGLLECLADERAVFETIQARAGERLGFLPRGNPMRSEVWSRLGRLLYEARTRFDRVLLALDFAVPHEVGPAIDGLGAAGWWCPDGSASILSSALAERIGIPLQNISLTMSEDVVHEMKRMLAGLLPSIPTVATPPAARVRYGPRGRRAQPQVVDCDLQVLERLRFLLWMRGIQSEGLHELEAQHQAQS